MLLTSTFLTTLHPFSFLLAVPDVCFIPQMFSLLSGLCLPELLVKEDLIHEMCRFGGAEIHSVAAFMGGVAAQEVIKLITRQFVPVNNTYIYNAMKQSSVAIKI